MKHSCPKCGGGPLYQDRLDSQLKVAHCDDCGEEISESEYKTILSKGVDELWICECCGIALGFMIDDETTCFCNDQVYGIRWSRIDDVDKFMAPFKILYQGTKRQEAWPEYVEWGMIQPHESRAKRNHSQSLKKLNSRGGLSPLEMYWVMRDLPLCAKSPEWPENDIEAMEIIIEWIEKHNREYYGY